MLVPACASRSGPQAEPYDIFHSSLKGIVCGTRTLPVHQYSRGAKARLYNTSLAVYVSSSVCTLFNTWQTGEIGLQPRTGSAIRPREERNNL